MAQAAYFGLPYIISLILVILPPTACVCGIILCIQREQYLFAVLRIFFGWNIIWIVDIVSMLARKDLEYFA